ncbi:PAS domain S-box protein [Bacillus sp. S/N-304-OC-R1]|uniref:PAS domain S-box protein n=1 Tax=Bacillus sp. S/N-304-OC-R1 TaxID=2758034 RepID=UPI001C8ECE55|nr:PAS domain S-box protein [Bacillus sp. S/N-304-OC-R1]MBY0121880.1 PAS domain S-box protein [Bacillus sp. S/N-304-OC-R1]
MNDMQQLFQTVLNYTSDMLMIVDRNRHPIYITPNVYELTGFTPEEALNRDAFLLIHPEDRDSLMSRHKKLLETEQSNSSEYRIIKKNGEIRYFECKTTPLPYTENYLQVVSVRDIHERKQMEIELEYYKNRHEILQTSLKNFSQELFSVMKLTDLEERLMKEIKEIIPDSNPTIMKGDLENVRSPELRLGKIEVVSDKLLIKIGEKKQRSYILSVQANAAQEKMDLIWLETLAHYSMMVFENLIMIENLVEQLETASQSKESPQWVLRMMFNLQEQQRLTLSSDLHDTVLQDQIDLYRRLESILNRYDLDKDVKSKFIEIEQGLLDIIHEIRTACNNLRPPLLRELGLERSLENLFEHIQVTSTYKIIFTAEDLSMLSLSEEQTIGIYRIVQEFLHYAEEYSKANLIKFDFYNEKDQVKIIYRDNGDLLEMNSENPLFENMRLANINQRAQCLGGRIDILRQNCGVMAVLELPIEVERSLGDG